MSTKQSTKSTEPEATDVEATEAPAAMDPALMDATQALAELAKTHPELAEQLAAKIDSLETSIQRKQRRARETFEVGFGTSLNLTEVDKKDGRAPGKIAWGYDKTLRWMLGIDVVRDAIRERVARNIAGDDQEMYETLVSFMSDNDTNPIDVPLFAAFMAAYYSKEGREVRGEDKGKRARAAAAKAAAEAAAAENGEPSEDDDESNGPEAEGDDSGDAVTVPELGEDEDGDDNES